MSEKLNQANCILDRTCKQAGLDPVAVRVAMINAIKDKQRTEEIAAVGKGFSRMAPETQADRKASLKTYGKTHG